MSNVIWVDDNDNVLGEVTRQKAHQEGLLHRVAVIYLVNDKSEILVNERAKDGHLDHSSAGHVDVGESYIEAAKRELEEELGIVGTELLDIAQDKGKIFNSKHMFRVYVCKASPIKLKEDEVKSVVWAKPDEVLKDMGLHPNKYTSGFKETIKVFLMYVSEKRKLPKIIEDVGFDFHWDSKKVWALDEPITEMDINELIWHFDVPFWEMKDTDDYNLTPQEVIKDPDKHSIHFKKVQSSDLKYPIDIMENKGRWLILDGLHRLVKANLKGQKKVEVRIIPRTRIPEILCEGEK